MSKEAKIIQKYLKKIKKNKITYFELCDSEEFWEEGVHVAMKNTKVAPPFYSSFDEYSPKWFKEVKKDFKIWLEHLIEVSTDTK
jgi:hypothetical protein